MPEVESAVAPKVGLFVSCAVDLMRPQVGLCAARLLEAAGCRVEAPTQSCCGQIADNGGMPQRAQALAWQLVEDFENFDYVVLPSGSCAGMIVQRYPALFEGDERLARVAAFCARVRELSQFLVEVMNFSPPAPLCDLSAARVSYHDGCAGLRQLGVRDEPRRLLRDCANVSVVEMADTEVCCGFGGAYSVKFPQLARQQAEDKLLKARDSKADILVSGDLPCLLHLQRHRRRGDPQPCHLAEALLGEVEMSGI